MGLLDNITGAYIKSNTNTQAQAPGVAECDRRLAELSEEKKRIFLAIGEKYAVMHMEDKAAGTDFESEMDGLIKADEEAAAVETRKLAIQGLRKCTACGSIITLDSAFCNKCGAKQEQLFESEVADSSVCPNCGAQREADSVFCQMCGYRLVNE